MKILILMLLTFVVFVSLKEADNYKPLGMVKINDKLYVDEVEVTNANWLEYLQYLSKTYGNKSNEYKKALPDTNVWITDKFSFEPNKANYFRHPACGSYPVVGVSYSQAIDFCKWRTQAVQEMLNSAKGKKHKAKFPNKFIYRLPSKREWELFASAGFSEKQFKQMSKKIPTGLNEEQKNLFLKTGVYPSPQTTYVYANWPNKLGVYNVYGNVSEMVLENGIAKGGSWVNEEEIIPVQKDIPYQSPTCWLGFRCVLEAVE